MDSKYRHELVQRAKKIDALEKRKQTQEVERIREGYAPEIERLKSSEAQIVELLPQVAPACQDAEQFPWHRVRDDGRMPEDVVTCVVKLRQCSGLGLNSIRAAIQSINEFSEKDLAGQWRPSKEIGGVCANAGVVKEMLGWLERQLEYWSERLERNLSVVGYPSEAIEGTAPATGGDDQIRVISNMH